MVDHRNVRSPRSTPPSGIAYFEVSMERLRQMGVYDPDQARSIPWAEVPDTRKLFRIVHAAHFVPPFGQPPVSGEAVLRVIDHEVNQDRLPSFQSDMLDDVRAKHRAGLLDGPHPKHNMDLAWNALADIASVGEFERMVEEQKHNPGWLGSNEDWKFETLMDLAKDAESPGTYTLKVIERELDFSGLSPWRSDALQYVQSCFNRGELGGDNPNPMFLGDQVNVALRLAQFESQVEDCKHIGVSVSANVKCPWSDLNETERLKRTMNEMHDLGLRTESKAYEIIGREVDVTLAPRESRLAFENGRKEAWPTLMETRTGEQTPSFEKLIQDNGPSQQQHVQRNKHKLGI